MKIFQPPSGVQFKAILSDVDNFSPLLCLVKLWSTFTQSQDYARYFPGWRAVENWLMTSTCTSNTGRTRRRSPRLSWLTLTRSRTGRPEEQHCAPTQQHHGDDYDRPLLHKFFVGAALRGRPSLVKHRTQKNLTAKAQDRKSCSEKW